MSDAKLLTIRRFTNLLDGSIIPRASIGKIIDYYEAQKNNTPIAIKQDCSITKKFIEAEIAEMEEEWHDEY
ncbi:MAG: hypothetical protein EBU90_12220 [Proteobacteria bacterium]|nr:hypothetical protein [Pseudomonadota bacterium]